MAWFCRELLVYPIFIRALYNPSVITWGRYSYRVHMGGTTTRIPRAFDSRRVHKPPVISCDTTSHHKHVIVNHSPELLSNPNTLNHGSVHSVNGGEGHVNSCESVRFKLFPLNDVCEVPMAKYLHKLPTMTKKNGYRYSKLEDPVLSAVTTPQIEA
ncbi:unnamed protein product [Echinostoma caproni]|uniref:Uncharacterized protein n=1 Tax=Echinostoma caproni TaxID=27848 RepID=A0A3P8HVZ1_9TREM|nr:unnamed protein product [Echinostoma caproni]